MIQNTYPLAWLAVRYPLTWVQLGWYLEECTQRSLEEANSCYTERGNNKEKYRRQWEKHQHPNTSQRKLTILGQDQRDKTRLGIDWQPWFTVPMKMLARGRTGKVGRSVGLLHKSLFRNFWIKHSLGTSSSISEFWLWMARTMNFTIPITTDLSLNGHLEGTT